MLWQLRSYGRGGWTQFLLCNNDITKGSHSQLASIDVYRESIASECLDGVMVILDTSEGFTLLCFHLHCQSHILPF